jgi:Acetyltransferases
MTLPDIAAFERAGLKAWPGIAVEWDGAWVRRAANGYTKRANSLQCFDPGDNDDAPARLEAGRAWFAARNLPPVIRTTPLQSPALTAALDAADWRAIDRSHLYAMPLGETEPDPQGRALAPLDPDFLAAQQALQEYGAGTMDHLRALLAVLTVPAAGIVIYRDGAPVASGLMAIADGIVITGNVITDPTRRRQGLAAAMMRTGLAWARANGAIIAALNVQADNEAAKALYGGLGYRHQYDYLYRIPKEA